MTTATPPPARYPPPTATPTPSIVDITDTTDQLTRDLFRTFRRLGMLSPSTIDSFYSMGGANAGEAANHEGKNAAHNGEVDDDLSEPGGIVDVVDVADDMDITEAPCDHTDDNCTCYGYH